MGIWRYVEAHAQEFPWKALRFWLPVQILALDFLWWAVVSSTQAASGGWLEVLGWVSGIEMFVLNLPAVPLGLLLIWGGVGGLAWMDRDWRADSRVGDFVELVLAMG